ncbi:MAG: TonB-dependent receptor [bacterium]
MRLLLWVWLALCCRPPDTLSEEAAGEETFFGGFTDTVYIDAWRQVETEYPTAAAVLTVVPLTESSGGADLAELLSFTAGLQIRRYGGLGAFASPSIRGSTAAQITILIDGVPLADSHHGSVSLASLPLERFERVEVYRGQLPARFGDIGAVGAVNLVSRQQKGRGTDLRFFGGSFGDHGGRWLQQWSADDLETAALLLVHGRRSDNNYCYQEHIVPDLGLVAPEQRRRDNAQLGEYGCFGSGRRRAGGWNLTGSAGYFRRDAGRPGPMGYESPQAVTRLQRGDGWLSLHNDGESLQLDLAASRNRERLHDDAGDVLPVTGTVFSNADQVSGKLTYQQQLFLADFGTTRLLAGTDWRREWYAEKITDGPLVKRDDPSRIRSTYTAFITLQCDLFGPRVSLLPAWRWQRLADNFPKVPELPYQAETPLAETHVVHATSPSIGVIWEAAADRLFLETHAARIVRPPNWVELFGSWNGIVGNRDLEPESIESLDLVARWRLFDSRLQGRLSFFQTWTKTAIVYRLVGRQLSRAENQGATRSRGIELETTFPLPHDGTCSFDCTWLEARDHGIEPFAYGNELPGLSPLQLAIQIAQPVAGWRLGLAVNHQAANHLDRYNNPFTRVPARTVFNCSLARRVDLPFLGFHGATVTVEALNLTDNVVYDVWNYPLPGKTYRVSLHLWQKTERISS